MVFVVICIISFGVAVFVHESTHIFLNLGKPFSVCFGCLNQNGFPDIVVLGFSGENVNVDEVLPTFLGWSAFLLSGIGLIVLMTRGKK